MSKLTLEAIKKAAQELGYETTVKPTNQDNVVNDIYRLRSQRRQVIRHAIQHKGYQHTANQLVV